MNALLSVVTAFLLYCILALMLTGAFAFMAGMVADAARKLLQLNLSWRSKKMFNEILAMIGQADTAVSGAFESMSARIAAAENNAITPEQSAAAKAQLQSLIDASNTITEAAKALIAPATPAAPIPGTSTTPAA